MKLIKQNDSTTRKIGFLDSSGAIIVPYVYDTVGEWKEGFIYVRRSGWRGFLDENADEVISLNEYVESAELPMFCNGVCVVSRRRPDGSQAKGCIDKTGAVVVSFENEYCKALSDSVFITVKDDSRYLRLRDGHSVDISEYLSIGEITAGDYITVSKVGKYGVEKWGCIDLYGNLVIPNIYDSILISPDKLITVKNGNRYGVIDVNGNDITGLIYTQALAFQNGHCAVSVDNKWGVIDAQGHLVVPMIYLGVRDHGDFLFVKNSDNSWSVLNGDGKTVTKFRYHDLSHFSEGRCAVKRLDVWGFVDESGNECIPCQFKEVGTFTDGRCKVKRTGLVTGNDNPWGEIDLNGNFTKMWENNNAENISKKVGDTFWKVGRFLNVVMRIIR